MKFQNILFNIEDRVGKLIINRPPPNILDIATLEEVVLVLERIRQDYEGMGNLKAIVVTGAGNHAFSTGVSVQDHLPDKAQKMIPLFAKTMRLMIELDQPVIAMVRGYCLGGGCEFASICDLVVAAESARFGQPEIKFGDFAPLAIALYPRLIGLRNTLELLLTGETVTAAEAQRLGLVNKVVPDDRLEEETQALIDKITGHSLVAIKANKRAIYAAVDLGFNEALNLVQYLYLNTLVKSHDGIEGLKAFLEKREPVWKDA
jgi:cyclohexa-1,5-dienecarbonyl-CoA hydratase